LCAGPGAQNIASLNLSDMRRQRQGDCRPSPPAAHPRPSPGPAPMPDGWRRCAPTWPPH
jgi:hypothetical protein